MKFLDVPQSGSVAGVTSSRNRFGQYRRTRATPVNPNTAAQSAMRSALGACASNWGGLDLAVRQAWAAWAAMHPQHDSLGQSVTLTGAMAFNKVNCLLVMLGRAAVVSPPGDPSPDAPELGSVVLDASSPGWDEATLAFTTTPVPSGFTYLIYGSPPRSLGTSFEGDFRYLLQAPASGVSPLDMASALHAKWGTARGGVAFYFKARTIADDGGCSMFSNVVRGVST